MRIVRAKILYERQKAFSFFSSLGWKTCKSHANFIFTEPMKKNSESNQRKSPNHCFIFRKRKNICSIFPESSFDRIKDKNQYYGTGEQMNTLLETIKNGMMRKAEITRETKKTKISFKLNIDGSGIATVSTGIAFLDHMLQLFAKHGFFDLEVEASGDLDVDYHHLVEDMGIAMGQAVKKALSDKAGIQRYGFFCSPMDETLATISMDISNRGYLVYKVACQNYQVRDFNIHLFKNFSKHLPTKCTIFIRLDMEMNPIILPRLSLKALQKALDHGDQT